MKSIFALAALTLGFAGSAFAHGHGANGPTRTRINAYNMTCSEVQGTIAAHGAAIVYESADIYDRYVSSGAYCPMGTYEKAAWISTADTDECPVSRCQTEDRGGGGF